MIKKTSTFLATFFLSPIIFVLFFSFPIATSCFFVYLSFDLAEIHRARGQETCAENDLDYWFSNLHLLNWKDSKRADASTSHLYQWSCDYFSFMRNFFFFFFLDINSIKNKTFFKEGQKKKDVESIYNVV